MHRTQTHLADFAADATARFEDADYDSHRGAIFVIGVSRGSDVKSSIVLNGDPLCGSSIQGAMLARFVDDNRLLVASRDRLGNTIELVHRSGRSVVPQRSFKVGPCVDNIVVMDNWFAVTFDQNEHESWVIDEFEGSVDFATFWNIEGGRLETGLEYFDKVSQDIGVYGPCAFKWSPNAVGIVSKLDEHVYVFQRLTSAGRDMIQLDLETAAHAEWRHLVAVSRTRDGLMVALRQVNDDRVSNRRFRVQEYRDGMLLSDEMVEFNDVPVQIRGLGDGQIVFIVQDLVELVSCH